MTPLLELSDVSKEYRGLRPLRIAHLTVPRGDRIAIVGLDQAAAEVFVNLITGTAVPDHGAVFVFGRPTTDIADSADWLSTVDRFGIVSQRAVLLDALTAVQNLAMPFTLDIEPPSDDIRRRAEELARAVGLDAAALDRPVGQIPPAERARVRLGRALALDPAILVLEHPTSDIPRVEVANLGAQIRRVAAERRVAVVALTGDREFADAVATRVLMLNQATGRLTERRSWFDRFRRA